MEIDASAVPLREPGMSPVEIMTSESQERMLAIVEPASLEVVLTTCARHEVRATVIGTVVEAGTDGVGRLVIRDGPPGVGAVVGDMPAASLADGAPLYQRPLAAPSGASPAMGTSMAGPHSPADELLALLYDPSFVYRQFDHQLFLNTVVPPGAGDATVLKLAGPGVSWTGKGLALTCDANPAWCAISPRLGTELTVAEAALNVSCAGGRPVAVVDCLNFGNPEHPEVMWQLSEAIDGMAAACLAFGVPVVGGNVSLYNESHGADIDPTPVVGLVGLIDTLAQPPPVIGLADGAAILLVGGDGSLPGELVALGGSRWARELRGEAGGALPELDFDLHGRLCELVRGLVAAEGAGTPQVPIAGLHDVSDGGLGVCLAELSCASGLGIVIDEVWTVEDLFSEAPSRVLVCSTDVDGLVAAAEHAGVQARVIGRAGGDRLVVSGLIDLAVEELASVRSKRLPEAADRAIS
jgi:phosphoribosylformylglycinamidine synthase